MKNLMYVLLLGMLCCQEIIEEAAMWYSDDCTPGIIHYYELIEDKNIHIKTINYYRDGQTISERVYKDNYIKILFDRLENKTRPHATAKIKTIRVINPNEN